MIFFRYVVFWWSAHCITRSSCPEGYCKKGLLKNFAKLTGKHLCQRVIFNKVAGPDKFIWSLSKIYNFQKISEVNKNQKICTNLKLHEKCPYSVLFWSPFSRFRLNTEGCGVPLPIWYECEKVRTRITPNTDTFYAEWRAFSQNFLSLKV